MAFDTSERARKAAQAMHAKHDGAEVTAKARETFLGRFKTEEEKREYFRQLAQKSNANRKRKP